MKTATPTIPEALTRPRPSRRHGYVAAVIVDGLMLVAVNIWPGWSVVPFLTDATAVVIPLVNLSLVAGIVTNSVYLVNDSPIVRSLGDLATTTIALVVGVRFWQVFPFDVSDTWQTLLRAGLALGVFGCAVGVVMCLVRVIGSLTGLLSRPR